jgi:hypothetical protein
MTLGACQVGKNEYIAISTIEVAFLKLQKTIVPLFHSLTLDIVVPPHSFHIVLRLAYRLIRHPHEEVLYD